MNSADLSIYYLTVRRFGNGGKSGKELDAYVKQLLRSREVFDKVRRDYDRMLSDVHPDWMNAMVGE